MHHFVDDHDLDEQMDSAARILRGSSRVVVLTGAGVSAESGVPTFRGQSGLWEGHRVEEVATPEGFQADPKLVWRFYNMRRAALAQVRPNPGHLALAALEKRLGSNRFTLLTQNIDGLHQAAGSQRVLELHGRLSRVRCTACPYLADRPGEALAELPRCPRCEELLRPDVVWFHEMLPAGVWHEACEQTESCDCFLVIGTSAQVYPAAGLIRTARGNRASVLEFNLERTPASALADVSLLGPSGDLLPQVLQRI